MAFGHYLMAAVTIIDVENSAPLYWGLRADYVGSSRTSIRLTRKKSIVRRRPVVTHDPVTVMVTRSGSIVITR
jgi:hypothetical protein